MTIRCINCGHNFELSNAYDDYEGGIKCWICGAIMEIKTQEGSLKFSRNIYAPHLISEETVK